MDVCRLLCVNKLADSDLLLEIDIDLVEVRSMPDLAVIVIELHKVETGAELVEPGVEGGAGGDYLDEGESFGTENAQWQELTLSCYMA